MDKKRSSTVPIIACLVVQLCIGIIYAWSALRARAIDYFHWDPAAATLVASYMILAFCAGNWIGGALNDRFGPKKISILGVALFGIGVLLSSLLRPGSSVFLFYLTYGILGGLGVGIGYGAILACMQMWMPHRRGLATGLAAGFFGLSTVVFSFVIKAMLASMALNTTLTLLAAIFLVIGLAACAFIRLPDAEYLATLPHVAPANSAAVSRESLTLGQAARTVPFWCLVCSIFFYNCTWNLLNPIIRDLGLERSLSENTATLLLSLTGLANAGGRLIMSPLSDKLGRIPTMHILSVATILCAALLMFAHSGLFFFAVLLAAFTFGGPAAINPATSTDFFGPKYAGTNYGAIMLSVGFSSLLFNYIATRLGDYRLSFLMGALSALVNIFIFLIIARCIRKKKLSGAAEEEKAV
jgi:OFA family oxalate/formate antiporter-like MFS transporter